MWMHWFDFLLCEGKLRHILSEMHQLISKRMGIRSYCECSNYKQLFRHFYRNHEIKLIPIQNRTDCSFFFFIAIVWKTYPENQIIFCSNIVILHTFVVIKTAIEQWRRSIIWKSNNSISKTNLRMSIELASFFLPFW